MSAATWAAVFQSILFIHGEKVPPRREDVIRKGAEMAGVDPDIFLKLWQVRRGQASLSRMAAWDLMQSVLNEVDTLARYVDGWQSQGS